jgi:formimidoylglutamate deiminase
MQMPHAQALFADWALLPAGWRRAVRLEIGPDGRFTAVTPDASPEGAERLRGPVLPGLVNVHCHAFQRAMAGLAERTPQGEGQTDTFWTWRQVMYRFLAALSPEDIEAIACHLYVELLRHGYTTVAEFHYLHHDPSGRPYAQPAELSLRILEAARTAGIALTLLPVLYAHSGFGGQAPQPQQRRFLNDSASYARLLDELHARARSEPLCRVGMAPHSLRAVTPDELALATAAMDALDPQGPIHLHIAEQEAEVQACLRATAARPVTWLLDHVAVGPRYCLVHATQMEPDEVLRLARSGAVVGLCPTTEANLGDGVFAGESYVAHGGRFAIGSDSNVAVDPFEELRLLEYSQRLLHKRRCLLAGGPDRSVGRALLEAALRGGAQAAGHPTSELSAGKRADLVVLDGDDPSLGESEGDTLLDLAVLGPSRGLVRDVLVAGRFVVRERHHPQEAAARARFRAVLRRLRTQ